MGLWRPYTKTRVVKDGKVSSDPRRVTHEKLRQPSIFNPEESEIRRIEESLS